MGFLDRLRRPDAADDDVEFSPPAERDVACRTLCLAAHSALGSAAHGLSAGNATPDAVHRFAHDLRDWLQREGLAAHQAASEREAFRRPLESWTEQELIDAGWRTESAGTLLWALGVFDEFAPYDEHFDGVPEKTPLLEPLDDFLSRVRLRSESEIEREREIAELWHWRSRTSSLQADEDFVGANPQWDFDEIVREVARRAADAGDIPPALDDDFPAFGKAYRELSEPEYEQATSLAMERHLALNWLCGYASDWDETPTDT